MDAVDHVVLGAGAVGMAVAEALAAPRGVGARRQPLRAARAGGGRSVRRRRRHRSGVRGVGDARRARRLPGAEPAVSPLGAGVPRPASGGDRRRAGRRRAAGRDGQRLHVRAGQRTAVHRGARLRRPHAQGPRPRGDGPRPDGRPRRGPRPGHRRARVGLLRTARRRAVADRRLGDPSRARRQARVGDGRPRHAAHLHLHPRHRREPRRASANATTRSDASGTCPVPRRAPRARSSHSSTRPPAPSRG